MKSKLPDIWLYWVLALVSLGAEAQTGTVPLASGDPPSGLTNSNISILNGNVGVGTASKGAKLEVNGATVIDGELSFLSFSMPSWGHSNWFNTGNCRGYWGNTYNRSNVTDNVVIGLNWDFINNSFYSGSQGGNCGGPFGTAAVQLSAGYGPGTISFQVGNQNTAPSAVETITPTGVGIGMTPQYTLDVNGSARIAGNLILPSYANNVFHTGNTSANISTYFDNSEIAPGVYPAWDTFSIGANWNDSAHTILNSQEGTALLQMRTNYGGEGSSGAMITIGVGNVNSPPTTTYATFTSSGLGIGTTTPHQKLEVNGFIQTDAGIYFPGYATPQTIPYTGIPCGGDYAESVDVTGDRTKYEPGDVLVIDPEVSGRFLKSSTPYSTAVTGIYSTKPGTLGRRQTTPQHSEEVPMAMLGIVPTKVSTENGVIHRGDLLVTSSTPGYAMKGTDRSLLTGAVIGKALDSFEQQKGVIEVVVTLQ